MNFDPELYKQAENIIELAAKANIKIVSAESCTGGLISYILTEISGSSKVFERGFVTYCNEAKIENLKVEAEIINKFGAVSPETAQQMAIGAVKNSNANLSIAITGIAGPSGGTENKPAGLIYMASFNNLNNQLIVKEFNFSKNRFQNRVLAAKNALQILSSQLIRLSND
ncbi:MAG: PncC family amidohydrolase [Lentimonas sp.]|jgi:PncC family amidohydrolase